jgi:3-dehydroquinate dehydratase-1
LKKTKHPLRSAVLVGTIHDAQSLRHARRLAALPAPPDWLEIRLDAVVPPAEAWPLLSTRPLLLTVRDAAEGGRRRLHLDERERLFIEFLPRASYLDLEIASLPKLPKVLAAARRAGVGLVASFHDFDDTPTVRKLSALAGKADAAGAEVFKIATTVNDSVALARLLEFIGTERRLPVAVMGMGKLGRLSRLALAAAGSILNYVSLGSAAAPGQWPAEQFRRRWQELQ